MSVAHRSKGSKSERKREKERMNGRTRERKREFERKKEEVIDL